MEKTILFLEQLLECAAGISFSRIPNNPDDISNFLKSHTRHIFDGIGDKSSHIFQPHLEKNTFSRHLILDTVSFLLYSSMDTKYVYIWGPVLNKPFVRENLLSVLAQASLSGHAADSVLLYCTGLPVMAEEKLLQIGELTIRQLTGTKKQQEVASPSPTKHYLHQINQAEENIIQMRQVETRYEHSAALTDAIKQGNLSLALHMIERYSPSEQTDIRNANPLRNTQNYCIVLNTQLRHALEETGIHPYRVDRLSNEIGLEIEQLKNTAQAGAFFHEIIRRYCRLVQEHTYPNLKPLVNLAVVYIKEHLTDNLTVKDTAKALTVNANYLSALFHREMGMTFIDFVNKERTRQAASLLKHTNLQIQQIATAVGYNNTSYFAKQFVRFQGVSPSKYKWENRD